MAHLHHIKAIVVGASHGGQRALESILSPLPIGFTLPIVIVLHRYKTGKERLESFLNSSAKLTVKQAEEKEKIVPGTVYIAPPDYHLLIEDDETLSFSTEEKVNYSRPSIDVLFETAADTYGQNVIGILLTGANSDGALGLLAIQEAGGFILVQNPEDAEAIAMPKAALRLVKPDKILRVSEIPAFLKESTDGSS